MFKTNAEKTALLKSCIKEDVSSQGETKRYLVGLCETRFIERHVSIPVKHSKLEAKNFNKVCSRTVHNALKWPLQYVNFQKFPGKHAVGPSEAFICSSTCSKLIQPEKNTLGKASKFGAPSLKKFLITPRSDMKHFQRAYLRTFSRLDVYRFCIYSCKHAT